MNYHDISMLIHPGMHVFKGDPPVEMSLCLSIEKGDSANVSMLSMGAHTGTHVDAPRHFINDGKTVDQIPLELLIGPTRVVEVANVREISRALISSLKLEGSKRLLFKTRNSLLWSENSFQEDFVYLTECASECLVEMGVQLVGIDYLSVERYGTEKPVAHITLLNAGVIILEGLDLTSIKPGFYTLVCLPLRIRGADGSPCRAILIEE